MIAGDDGVFAGYRRQVWSGVANGLHAWLFIHRNRDHDRIRPAGLVLQRDLLVNQQNFSHLSLEVGIAALQIIFDFMRAQGLCGEDALHRGLACLGQGWIACLPSMLANMPCQRGARPELRRITEILGFATC